MRSKIPLIALLVLTLVACAQVEGTNRRQLLLTSPAQENQMGLEAYDQVQKEEKRCTDAATIALVERVGKRLAAAAPDHGFQYEFVVLDSPTVNAFCLPGGKVAVYTGLLPWCHNEAGLATVLGHEIAHAIARHGGERMSQGMVQQVGQQTLAAALQAKGISPTTTALTMTAYNAGSQYLGVLPFSRLQESEADHLGLIYLAKAGYDPAEAVKFWDRFSQLGGSTPTWLSTHPSSPDRARQLADLMPEAQQLYAAAKEKHGAGAAIPARWGTKP